jgi:glycosyltransferase involved in cell wall biosynthesis
MSPLASGIEGSGAPQKSVRVLAFMEALWPTTGPAKNLLEFACRAAVAPKSLPRANIEIATYHRGTGPISSDFVLACQKAGLEVHIIHERFLFDLAVVPAIRELIARRRPDIIQSHAVKSHFLIRLAAIHRERPWIAFHHGYTWTSPRTRIYNQLDRWSLRAASRVVTVCRPFASDLEEIGVRPERIVVRHNSVKSFSPAREEVVVQLRQTLGISENTQVLLCVGRLSREKAQADLIEAAALMRREGSQANVRFVVAGDGHDRQKLQDMARSLLVEDWFIFAGQVADLVPYYTMADLVVMPSHTEGSPNVLLEAMAAGLPIIATAVGGVPEIVENEKQALLVEKHNPMALARAIEQLLNDANLRKRLSEAARQSISSYSPEAYYDSILSLYQACLVGKYGLSNS